MAVKGTGAEFLAFYQDPEFWPKGAWHDDTLIWIDGEFYEGSEDYATVIQPTSKVRIEGGGVYDLPNGREASFETHFKAWRKKQTTTTFVVSGPKGRADEMKALLKANGFKVDV